MVTLEPESDDHTVGTAKQLTEKSPVVQDFVEQNFHTSLGLHVFGLLPEGEKMFIFCKQL